MLPFVTPAESSPDAKLHVHYRTPENLASDGSLPCRKRGQEIALTIRPLPGEGIMELFGRLADALHGTTILNMLIFGSVNAKAVAMRAMRQWFGRIDWPVMWVEGGACDLGPIAGIQVFGFDGGAVQRVLFDKRVVGSVFQDSSARYCLLGGLGPTQRFVSRADQAKQTLENLESALVQAGFSIADTVRTWFYLEDILSWYHEFNQARTQVYSGIKFRTGSLPASTGVGAQNPAGAALTLGVRAMQPLTSSAFAAEIASPLQCPALVYGSSFSRAMEIYSAFGRHLLISGTASVAPTGQTSWRGDARKQVEQTMRVVEAILRSRGFDFLDLTRATAYFKHRAHTDAFTEWCIAHDLLSLPVVVTNCDLCRDDLLFELEADAWRPNRMP
jgi:enamine deaminase RidA (YjgF/YER057c/UK114 family)